MAARILVDATVYADGSALARFKKREPRELSHCDILVVVFMGLSSNHESVNSCIAAYLELCALKGCVPRALFPSLIAQQSSLPPEPRLGSHQGGLWYLGAGGRELHPPGRRLCCWLPFP